MCQSMEMEEQEKTGKSNLSYRVHTVLADILEILVSLYMVLLIAVMPFYFTDGYRRIGTNKYEFFEYVTRTAAAALLPVLLLYLLVSLYLYRTEKKGWKELLHRISLTDLFAAFYGITVILSYLGSDFKEAGSYGSALKGAAGWYMGLTSQLAFVGIYFAISRLWKCRKWIPTLFMPVTTVVFALGFLNRFDYFPFPMENANIEFISTIGNMNWYCCYAVMIFFAILYFDLTGIKSSRMRKLSALWIILGFATLLTQGSLSGLVTVVAMMGILYLLSMKQGDRLERVADYCVFLGIAAVLTYLLRASFPGRFNYPDTFTDLLTFSPFAAVLLMAAVWIRTVIKKLREEERLPIRFFTLLGYGACIFAGAAGILFVLLVVINTLYPGRFGPLSQLSALQFNLYWGSNRGATWTAGIRCFQRQALWGKLFGVGPDSMVLYIQSGADKELLAMIREVFINRCLTNTHNEWLTVLVNEGLLGMIAYVGMIVSAIVRYIKGGRASSWAGACGFGILAYTINNMFSFQQAMATGTMFVLLGMGEAFIRKKYKK